MAIQTIQQVITWLDQQPQGGDLTVSVDLFDAPMVAELFAMLPSPANKSIPLTNIAVDTKTDPQNPTLTGTATIYGEENTTFTFTFLEQYDAEKKSFLIANLVCEFTTGASWSLLDAFNLSLQKPIRIYYVGDAVQQTVYLNFKVTVQAGKDSDQSTKIPVIISAPPYDGNWAIAIDTEDPAWQQGISLNLAGLVSMLGGQNLSEILPPDLLDLNKIKLQAWAMSFNPQAPSCDYISMSIGYDEAWTFFSGKFSVSDPTLTVEVLNPLLADGTKGELTFQALLNGKMTIGGIAGTSGITFDVGGQFIGEDKAVYVQLAQDNNIKLGPVFDFFQLKLPQGLTESAEIDTLSFVFYTAQDSYDFMVGTSKPITIVKGVDLSGCYFDMNGQHDNGKFIGSGTLASTFTIAGVDLAISASYASDQGILFEGSTGAGQDIPVGDIISDLAKKMGVEITLPGPIADIRVKNLSASFNTGTQSFTFRGDAQFSADPNPTITLQVNNGTQSETPLTFDLAINTSVDLSNLPIIASALSIQEKLVLKEFHVGTAANARVAGLAGAMSGATDEPTTHVYLQLDLQAGQESTSLAFDMDDDSSQPARLPTCLPSGDTPSDSLALAPQATSSQGAHWIPLQKNFGPLYFDKVGLQYTDSNLFVLLNVSATVSALELSLEGLGVSLPIDGFNTQFTLDGMGITYAGGPVKIGGDLQGSIDPVNLTGSILIGTEALSIAGIGGYTLVDNHPSMFLYAVIDYPIGGPPFFFVTGLAAGFGFNRKLLLPDINGVATFPFVEWAMGLNNPPIPRPDQDIGEQVSKVLQELVDQGIVAPEVGSDWLTAGVRFTSFEMIDSFALVTMVFGTDVEIALLGLSVLSVPTGVTAPIIYAELALKASIPANGEELSVRGQLTNSSYVLSKDCHLTGGFAFCAWFSGDHAGDFVITMGGYNPNYTLPAQYPIVPRLGINWQVADAIEIKGEEYFAMTPNAIMAGGFLEASWHGGGIKAWFSVEADFLIVWKPFHYDIHANVDIGASFKLNLLFTSIDLTIHVGVGLHLWGPDFSGIATVHLSIISFDIAFGSGDQDQPKPIAWSEFTQQLLPQKPSTSSTRLLADDPANPDVCKITIAKGLIKELSDQEGTLNWVVNPEELEITTQSIIPATVIPSNEGSFQGKITLAPDDQQPHEQQYTTLGVRPVGLNDQQFSSEHTLALHSEENSAFHAIKNYGSVPKALWDISTEIGDPVNDTTLDNVLTGFTLKPYVAPPDSSKVPIDLTNLQYTIDPNIQSYLWSVPYVSTQDPFKEETVATTIEGPAATNNRPKLLAAIIASGLAIDSTIEVEELSSAAKSDLTAQPALRLLGEEKAA
ncbi:MAG: DUF6603 domain-containing protein [Roseivirga sp.]